MHARPEAVSVSLASTVSRARRNGHFDAMNSYSEQSGFSGHEVRSISIAVVCGVAALLWLGSQLRPAAAPQAPAVTGANFQNHYHGLPNPMEATEEHAEVLKRLAERSGGNYNRLSDDEKIWLEAAGGGMGALLLRNEVQFLARQHSRTRRPAGRPHNHGQPRTRSHQGAEARDRTHSDLN
jgi:hypothetical protein